jgi:hypothetical protein
LSQVSRTSFTDQQIADAFNIEGTIAKAAKMLSEMGKGTVSPQLFRYWLSKLDVSESHEVDRAKELAKVRNAQAENNKLRRDNRALIDALGSKNSLIDGITDAVRTLNRRKAAQTVKQVRNGTPLTVEIVLSDLQIGKLSSEYNTPVAFKRLQEFGAALVFQIKQKIAAGFKVERIILAIIGDIIESDKKHDNSARATDTGTAEQIHDATVGIFEHVLTPLAALGIPIDVPCVTGNHDWDGHGITMFRPGREQLSYPLYKALELVCRTAGYGHVAFDIVDGSFTTSSIYGQKVLYEHGVGVAVTEASMKAHKIKRSEQLGKYITYFRMGDKHNVCSFNSGQYVVNGAFFGSENTGVEYSSIAGFSSVAAQWMGFHTPRKDGRFTLYDTFTIQLAHVK